MKINVDGDKFIVCPFCEKVHKASYKCKAVSDNVNHPSHYTSGGIETIDYLQAKLSKSEFIGYLKGNILKYVSRAELKNGTEDYKKAQWYINKLIEVTKGE